MKYLAGVLCLIIALLSFIALVLILGATIYIALTNPSYSGFPRQIALIVCFGILWFIAGIFGAYLRVASR